MKFVKGISLFLIYPLVMLGIGFFAGVEAVYFFYPGIVGDQAQESAPLSISWPDYIEADLEEGEKTVNRETNRSSNKEADRLSEEIRNAGTTGQNGTGIEETENSGENEEGSRTEGDEAVMEVASASETLSVDTEYVLEETDILRQSVVETVWRLPPKYVGMNREQFLVAMESYAAFPPLIERERGFVGLEVLSFSRERVVVQMNYRYLQPGEGFYLAVEDNEVVVYQEDQQTIYINTGISLDSLPDNMQIQVIQMMWIEDEESLYDFLEAYSS